MQNDAETHWIVTLDIVPTFVWRTDMTCLVPIDEAKSVPDLRSGDHVLFNKRSAVVSEIRPYQ